MRSLKSENGQGLVEYAITLVLVALLVCVAIGGFYFLIALVTHPLLVWPAIVEWGTNLVAGLKQGDPKAIFIAIVITLVFLFLFGRRRR